ncbi:sigma-70 family RNA polymerase sigma factor [Microbacterium marinilacus]|nr:sigma-70 family RNA polymerase sigma factor [Microbacterium marinilacus]MBY0687068.1 sigma-70 family RNA polymerase sigma factor [Microbacterium marinilacus]
MTTEEIPDAPEAAPDTDLVLRSRSGDADAFGELWRRHYRSGVVVARSVTSSIDADDLVQEAYTRIFQAIRRGGGPTGAFRAYLFTAIRNTAAGWGRARSETAIDELETIEDPETTDEATMAALDRSLTHNAFRSLPSRWQEVLWYTEIEQLTPAQIAPLLSMKPAAVSQLSFRAREGLREAWIQAHLNSLEDGSECQWAIEHLGAHTRGNLGARNQNRLDTHLADCPRCTIVAGEAQEVGSRLALVLLPLTIGVGATASYLAALQRDDAAAVALAAMPSHVVEGAVVAGGGLAAGASGGDGGGSGAGGASTSGSAWTVGGLVAAGAAALAVAATVVAFALSPGLGGAGDPAAGADASDSPSAEVDASPELVDKTSETEAATPSPSPSPTNEPTTEPGTAAPPTIETPAPEPSQPEAEPTTEPEPEPTPVEEPAEPAPLALDSARSGDSGDVVLDISGEPGSTVQAFALTDATSGSGGDGSTSAGVPLAVAMAAQSALAETTLDDSGSGVLSFPLTLEQVRADVTIEIVYVDSDAGSTSHRLSEFGDLVDQLLAVLAPSPEPTEPVETPTPTPTQTETPAPTETPVATETPTPEPTTPSPTPSATEEPEEPTTPGVTAACGYAWIGGGITCTILSDSTWGDAYIEVPDSEPRFLTRIVPGVPIQVDFSGDTDPASALYVTTSGGVVIPLGTLGDLLPAQ